MEWKEVRLGDICEIKGGKRLPKGVSLVTQKNEHPYIRIRDLGNKKVIELDDSYEYVDDETQKSISKYIVSYNDILISIVGTIGLVAKVGVSLHNANLTENCVKLINLHDVEIDYLYYFLTSQSGQNKIKQGTVGAVQPKLPIKNIQDIIVPLPTRINQKRIADILSSLDAKIENNNKINAKLEEMAQALFKSWFIDFEPFKDGPFVESELGMIPEGWKVGSPYEYFDVIYGAPYKSALFNSDGNGLPLIRIRDLKDCKPQFYSPEILPNTEFVEYGDIVAGMDAEFTPYVWRGERGLLNQRVCKIVPKNLGISRLYGLLLFKPELEYVQSYKTGTTVSHLGKADIDRFKVILPSECIVKQFSAIADSILNEQILLAKEINNLTQTRDTLLPKLMSGEIEL